MSQGKRNAAGGAMVATSIAVLAAIRHWHLDHLLSGGSLDQLLGDLELPTSALAFLGLCTVSVLAFGAYIAMQVEKHRRATAQARERAQGFERSRAGGTRGGPAGDEAPEEPAPPPGCARLGCAGVCCVLGLLCLLTGWSMFSDWVDAAPLPVPVDVVELEQGAPAPNAYVRLGKHMAFRQGMVFRSSGNTVSSAWYPILSARHPFVLKMRQEGLTPDRMVVVPRARMDELGQFAVLAQNTRWRDKAQIPDYGEISQDRVGFLKGLASEYLQAADRDAIQGQYPKLDLTRVQVLEDGGRPPALGSLFVAACFALVALFGAYRLGWP